MQPKCLTQPSLSTAMSSQMSPLTLAKCSQFDAPSNGLSRPCKRIKCHSSPTQIVSSPCSIASSSSPSPTYSSPSTVSLPMRSLLLESQSLSCAQNVFQLMRKWTQSPGTPLIASTAPDEPDDEDEDEDLDREMNGSHSSGSEPLRSNVPNHALHCLLGDDSPIVSSPCTPNDMQRLTLSRRPCTPSNPIRPDSDASTRARNQNNFSIDSILTSSPKESWPDRALSHPSVALSYESDGNTHSNRIPTIDHFQQLDRLNRLNHLSQITQFNHLNHLSQLQQLKHHLSNMSPGSAAATAAAAAAAAAAVSLNFNPSSMIMPTLTTVTQPHLTRSSYHESFAAHPFSVYSSKYATSNPSRDSTTYIYIYTCTAVI
jgi:hypothetical protein